ncbi:MAG TPA: hypothetical protein VM432_10225 [Bdellovibrionales bacterium]|nr:hypothetical protein [Bdellovibrionales bacterium]
MKRIVAAMSLLVLVSQANALVVPPLGPYGIAAGIAVLVFKVLPKHETPTTIVTPEGEGYRYDALHHITSFPNSDLYEAEKPKLFALRAALATKFPGEMQLGEIGGMEQLLNYKWSNVRLKKQYRNVPQTLTLTVDEFFGTVDAPDLANLATLAIRVQGFCTYHKAECVAAGGMTEITPEEPAQ